MLSFRSSHPKAIHLSWLTGYFQRLYQNVWSSAAFGEAKEHALRLLRKAGLSKPAATVIDHLTRFVNPVCPFLAPQPTEIKQRANTVWVTFDYHPALFGIVQQALAHFHQDAIAQYAWRAVFGCRF